MAFTIIIINTKALNEVCTEGKLESILSILKNWEIIYFLFLSNRHTSLSFRNSNPNERNAWHSNTRGLPGRSRRDASSTTTTKPTVTEVNVTQNAVASTTPKDVTTQEILVVGNNTNVGFVQDPDSDTRLRSRRNVPECITNYKAQRQLWIGCTEPNVIDVRPLCNDEGDEGRRFYQKQKKKENVHDIF